MAAAGSISITTQQSFGQRPVRWFELPFTTHASTGNVAENPIAFPAGDLLIVDFIPGAVTPTTACDLTLLDANGVDVLDGQGANLDTSKVTRLKFNPGTPFAGGALTPTLINAGNSKTGTLIVMIAA